jgi:hypothetical protein
LSREIITNLVWGMMSDIQGLALLDHGLECSRRAEDRYCRIPLLDTLARVAMLSSLGYRPLTMRYRKGSYDRLRFGWFGLGVKTDIVASTVEARHRVNWRTSAVQELRICIILYLHCPFGPSHFARKSNP